MKRTTVTCDVCGGPARYSLSLERPDGRWDIYDGGYGWTKDLCNEHADLVIASVGAPSDVKRDGLRRFSKAQA